MSYTFLHRLFDNMRMKFPQHQKHDVVFLGMYSGTQCHAHGPLLCLSKITNNIAGNMITF